MDAPYKVSDGSSAQLGATAGARGVNFALYSANCQKVELCLFDTTGNHEIARIPLPAHTGDIWHGYIEGLKPGQLYGYRVHGPYDPANGHRFNPHKLLLDPYAREFGGAFKWDDSHYGYTVGHPDGDLSFDTRDNASFMIKAKVTAPPSHRQGPQKPGTSWRETIIYEAHVRGLTMEHPDVPRKIRGTFEGVADDAVIDHLKNLGVTAIELLPVQAFFNDEFLKKRNLQNFWGYNTLGFFAPEPRYGNAADFKAMVDKFHQAGIEVILDVVYNHTFEGSEIGPTVCFRGIDNASYYRLLPHEKRKYVDDSGCGNTINADNPAVRRMIVDSLRFWAEEMGVDGFRFDLAPILGRHENGFSSSHPFFHELRSDPVLSKIKLIAEPWDIGPGGYQVGHFPSEWHEWNDIFRDETRGFWHGHHNHIGKIAYGLTGSQNHFSQKQSGASASINFITAHDGFTLNDLVCYSYKHNFDNGEHNRDGHGNNISDNHGVEGPTRDPAITRIRERQKRNFMATLMLSQGTPMILAGDEIGNSQKGNNNAYCQDNPKGWINWSNMDRNAEILLAFTRKLSALRKKYPVLNSPAPLNGNHYDNNGIRDITWYTPAGEEKREEHWRDPNARTIGVIFNGAALPLGHRQDVSDDKLLLIFNAHSGKVPFKLPQLPGHKGWMRILDTAAPDIEEGVDLQLYQPASHYDVIGKSLLVFKAEPS